MPDTFDTRDRSLAELLAANDLLPLFVSYDPTERRCLFSYFPSAHIDALADAFYARSATVNLSKFYDGRRVVSTLIRQAQAQHAPSVAT